MALSTAQLALIEQRITNDGPSAGIAYALWFFTGLLGGHRFYLGRPGTAVLMILLNLVFIGLIWVLIDAFLIPGMIQSKRNDLRLRLMTEMMAMGGEGAEAPRSATPAADQSANDAEVDGFLG